MNPFKKLKNAISNLPNRKNHLDFFTALLSVPVLLTVIITNVLNLQKNNKPTTPTDTPVKNEKPIVIENKVDRITEKDAEPTDPPITPVKDCVKEVGPVSIRFPSEGQTVSDNPVCINIKYDDPDYCSVVWSYRINGGSWSDYSSNSVCLYSVPKGEIKFDLRVQSTVSEDDTTLSRTFKYEGDSSASESGSLN